MNVLLYTSRMDGPAGHLLEAVSNLLPLNRFDFLNTVDGLYDYPRRPGNDERLVIILALTQEEFHEVHTLRPWLSDVRLILVLPDSDRETIRAGHMLRPRFLSYAQSDFQDVAAVLAEMLAGPRTATIETRRSWGELPSGS
ncbi:MAG: hypothetical protein AB1641_25860 [Thermodesulfobacteriota bacterium]